MFPDPSRHGLNDLVTDARIAQRDRIGPIGLLTHTRR
jgi:hypothetical protein